MSYSRAKCFFNKDKYKGSGIIRPQGYATDGLFAWFDGICNTQTGEHDNSATSWYDLTGNGYDLFPNISDINCHFIDNGFRYQEINNGNSFALISNQSHPTDSIGFMEVEIVFEIISHSSGAFVLWDTYKNLAAGEATSSTNYDANAYGYYTTIEEYIKLNPGGMKYYQSINATKQTLELNKKYYLRRRILFPRNQDGTNYLINTLMYNSDSGTVETEIPYNISSFSAWRSGSFAYENSKICLFSSRTRLNESQPMNANAVLHVYALRYYNRQLGVGDIAQNFAADKARFNM